jgi:hypothetical protein
MAEQGDRFTVFPHADLQIQGDRFTGSGEIQGDRFKVLQIT